MDDEAGRSCRLELHRKVRRLAADYLDPRQMVWVVVGDAATQRARLDALGLGPSILLDREGRRIEGG